MIFVIALVVFGPQKLPDLGRSAGKMIAEFRKVSRELSEDVTRAAMDVPESRPAARRSATPAAPPPPAALPAPAEPAAAPEPEATPAPAEDAAQPAAPAAPELDTDPPDRHETH